LEVSNHIASFNEEFNAIIEYPWTRVYLVLMQVSERNELIASDAIFSLKKPGFLRKHWEEILPLTLLDPFRLGKIVDLVIETAEVPGDILECGSYKGGSGILMALLVKELGLDKKVHLFDSFEGLPEPHEKDKGYRKGQFKSDYDKLSQVVTRLGLQEIVVLHRGWFDATIPAYVSENGTKPVSIFHIDCDLYNSTMGCFPQIYPLVEEGGVVILDDYNDGGRGEKFAVLETLNSLNVKEKMIVGPASHSYFFKGHTEGKDLISDGGILYDLTEILNNKAYLSWLEETIGIDYSEKYKAQIK